MSNIFDSNIYDMSEALNDMAQQYIPEVDEKTLAVGSYGYWNAVFAQNLSNNIRIAQENSNEMFYNKARQPKNVLAFAIQNDIDGINAVPAVMPIQLWIIENDLSDLINEHDPTNKETMVISSDLPFYIGDYEFHLDYDLHVTKREVVSGNVYSGKYDMSIVNPLSDIESPYIDTPYRMTRNGNTYVCFSIDVRQIYKNTITNKLISSNVIENKTYQFSFENQLADFNVKVTENNVTTLLTPVFSGASTANIDNYCNYTMIDDETIRVIFDPDSYMPNINAEVVTTVQTTNGNSGNFTFNESFALTLKDTDKYTYLSTQVFIFPQGKSEGGKDAKTTEELQRLLPQQFLARGSLINNTDLNNYFNQYNTETSKLTFQKKIHNQLERRYFGYYLHKDNDGNVVPTNTINLTINIPDLFDQNNPYISRHYEYSGNTISSAIFTFESGSYIGFMRQCIFGDDGKPLSTTDESTGLISYTMQDIAFFIINPDKLMSEYPNLVTSYLITKHPEVDPYEMSDIREEIESMRIVDFYNEYAFLYTLPYKTSITSDGPYISFYMTIMDEIYRINYEQGNPNSPIEMILTYATWTRPYKGESKYTMLINVTQSIDDDYYLLQELESASVNKPNYTLTETFVNEDGTTTTVANNYSDITELLLLSKLSTADTVTATDNNNPSAGNILNPDQVTYYVVANKTDSTITKHFNTEVEASDQYNVFTLDTEYLYIKMVDSNGATIKLLDKTSSLADGEEDEEEEDVFETGKTYIVAHTNSISGQLEEEEYTSLLDALNESALKYYSSVPVVNYTITEVTNGTPVTNSLYNAATDSINNDLVFIQVKTNEGLIIKKSTIAEATNVINNLPIDQGLEYRVVDKYGYVDSTLNTFTEDYEESEMEQEGTVTVFDDYSDYDSDNESLYTEKGIYTDKLIMQRLKVVFYNSTSNKPTNCKYVDTLVGAIKYIAKSKTSCKLFYANSQDISTTSFTTKSNDLIYSYDYSSNPLPIARFMITSEIEAGTDSEKRHKIYVSTYTSESEVPLSIAEYISQNQLDININNIIANMYQFGTSSNLLYHTDLGDTSYTDSAETDDTTRTYVSYYTKNGYNISSSSMYELEEILALYADESFAHNRLIKREASGVGVVLFDGLRFKEKYYLEFFNDEGDTNCYVINTRAKLANVYARVKNTIEYFIANNVLTDSDDYHEYINVYDQFGNVIDIEESYTGSVLNGETSGKYYPIWNYIKIDSLDANNHSSKIFTNPIKAISYAYENMSSFAIKSEYSSYTIDSTNKELYLVMVKSQSGNRFKIFTSESDYLNSSIRIEESDSSNTPTTQSYLIKFDDETGEIIIQVLYMKDNSNTNGYIDISTITDRANIGIADTSAEDNDNEEEDDEDSGNDSYTEDDESDDLEDEPQVAALSLEDEPQVAAYSPEESQVATASLNEGIAVVNQVDIDTETNETVSTVSDAITLANLEASSTPAVTSNTVSSLPSVSSTGLVNVNGKKVICKTAAIMIIYKDNEPVCYYKSDLYDYSIDNGTYSYVLQFEPITKDLLDSNNNILLEAGNANNCTGCHFVGGNNNGAIGSTYVPANAVTKIYLLSKFTDEEGIVLDEYSGMLGLNSIISSDGINNLGLKDYIVTNIYSVKNGIDFYEDFSEIVNSTVTVNTVKPDELAIGYQTYTIKSLPVIRYDYTSNNDKITEYMKNLKEEKTLIEDALMILENQYQCDLKFYNTYGPAHIYYTSDTNGENVEILDRVNISLTFAIKLKKASDDYTAGYIIKDIKDAIESFDEINDYHLENLASDLYQTYKNSIYYIEFRGFNDYDSNRRHFFIDKSIVNTDIPPEFININILIDGDSYTPDINVPTI